MARVKLGGWGAVLDGAAFTSYFTVMITLSEADARLELSNLIDRALAGEGIVITREGLPVAELKAMLSGARAITDAELDWLAANRIGRKLPKMDAGALLGSMRDEDR